MAAGAHFLAVQEVLGSFRVVVVPARSLVHEIVEIPKERARVCMIPRQVLRKVLVCLVLMLAAHAFQVSNGVAGQSEPSSPSFRFVQITDTHLGSLESLARLDRVVRRINKLPYPVACVVHSGDVFADNIADPDRRRQGLRILKRLEPPLYAAPGNHDILRSDLEATRTAWTEAFSGLVHTHSVRGVRFVLSYTYPLSGSFNIPGYDPMERIQGALSQGSGDPVVMVHHAPSLPEFKDGGLRGGWSEAKRREWRRMLRQNGVIAVLAGHFHRGELHWVGDVPLYVAPPVAGSQRPAAFRVYTYSDGRLSHRTFRVPISGAREK